MCGIAGSINHSLNIPELTRVLYHRGPDEQATFGEERLQLHHHRLAILDIDGGRQPMHYQHLTIIFNGEMYNHLEVRSRHRLDCITNSDTEPYCMHMRSLARCASMISTACLHLLSMTGKQRNCLLPGTGRGKNRFIIFQMEIVFYLRVS